MRRDRYVCTGFKSEKTPVKIPFGSIPSEVNIYLLIFHFREIEGTYVGRDIMNIDHLLPTILQ
jgi:hypothetical protein